MDNRSLLSWFLSKRNRYKNNEFIILNFKTTNFLSLKEFVLKFNFFSFFSFCVYIFRPKNSKHLASLRSCFVYGKHRNLYLLSLKKGQFFFTFNNNNTQSFFVNIFFSKLFFLDGTINYNVFSKKFYYFF